MEIVPKHINKQQMHFSIYDALYLLTTVLHQSSLRTH